MNPLNDDELTKVLRKLEPSPAPATLETRVFGSRIGQSKGRQWKRTILYSVRIPIPVVCLMVLALFALGVFAFRASRPGVPSAGRPGIGASGGSGKASATASHVTLTQSPNQSTSSPHAGQDNRESSGATRLDDQTLSVPGGAVDRNLITSPEPTYPLGAKEAGPQGSVKLKVRISPNGRVTDVTVLSGNPILAPAAVEVVKQRIYRPTLLNGKPIAVISEIDVAFRLDMTMTSTLMQ